MPMKEKQSSQGCPITACMSTFKQYLNNISGKLIKTKRMPDKSLVLIKRSSPIFNQL